MFCQHMTIEILDFLEFVQLRCPFVSENQDYWGDYFFAAECLPTTSYLLRVAL